MGTFIKRVVFTRSSVRTHNDEEGKDKHSRYSLTVGSAPQRFLRSSGQLSLIHCLVVFLRCRGPWRGWCWVWCLRRVEHTAGSESTNPGGRGETLFNAAGWSLLVRPCVGWEKCACITHTEPHDTQTNTHTHNTQHTHTCHTHTCHTHMNVQHTHTSTCVHKLRIVLNFGFAHFRPTWDYSAAGGQLQGCGQISRIWHLY